MTSVVQLLLINAVFARCDDTDICFAGA